MGAPAVVVPGDDAHDQRAPSEDRPPRRGYVVLEREFRPRDVVDVRIPMSLAVDWLPGSQEYAALRFGPIVLAGRLGTKD